MNTNPYTYTRGGQRHGGQFRTYWRDGTLHQIATVTVDPSIPFDAELAQDIADALWRHELRLRRPELRAVATHADRRQREGT